MSIPKNIRREHILEAIKYVDEHGFPTKNESTKYDLIYNKKAYPPKYIISRANVYVNGHELPVTEFSGGDETNNVLQQFGFEIIHSREEKIPPLEPKERSREYDLYSDTIRDRIVFEYLFHSRTHRWLDEQIIGLNADESRGYQSMGILHYIGLRDKHKGIFQGLTVSDAIDQLMCNESNFSLVISSLKRSAGMNTEKENNEEADPETDEFEEGREKLRLHKIRERDPQLIKEAKKRFKKKHGCLFCEACGINFEKVYGERGKNFIEGHHKKPVSEMKEGETTKVEDIGMLCSNCHRMIHRYPMISIEELKESVLLMRRMS